MKFQKYEYLTDSTFLKYFDLQRLKQQFVKITVLDWAENPIKDIEGVVTDGSINFDGNSAIRRTASLSTFIDSIDDVNYYLSLNKKVYIEIGFKNDTRYYTQYEKIWFPMGLFVITSCSLSHSNTGVTVSLQLKDKMCLLNGECGGTFPAAVTFDRYDYIDENGNLVTEGVTIYQILVELLNHWGNEPIDKILISDIDNRIKQVMKWAGSYPIYLTNQGNGYEFITSETEIQRLEDLGYIEVFDASAVLPGSNTYIKYTYNDDVGYTYTDFTFTGSDLVATAGQNICNILDSIKNLLGNYEYFYDLEGNFVFREIKNYLNTSYSSVVLNELTKSDYEVNQSKGKVIYTFDDSSLISSYSNNPSYENIKNDFIIWGKKRTAGGSDIPIRYHLVIDTKPEVGNTYQVFPYTDPDDDVVKAKTALEFAETSDLPTVGRQGFFYYVEEDDTLYTWSNKTEEYVELEDVSLTSITPTDWRTELYLSGVDAEAFGVNSNYYYAELANEWPKLYDFWSDEQGFKEPFNKIPSECNYFLDFIDSNGEIGEFSVSNIGRRTHVEQMDAVNCIFAPSIPDLIILETANPNIEKERQECIDRGQKYTQIDESLFSQMLPGGSFYAAFDAIKTILYENTKMKSTISIQCIPIYYLDVNYRISVTDPESAIYGDYVINSFQIPLNISGTMSINASKAIEKL